MKPIILSTFKELINIPKKIILTKEQEEKIKTDYLYHKKSMSKISKENKISYKAIDRFLTKNNYKRSMKEQLSISNANSNFSLNEEKLDFNNQNFCYICGLFASDGTIEKTGNGCRIELKSIDKEVLDKINVFLENERPIKTYSRLNNNYEYSIFYVYNKKLKDKLKEVGIKNNKTYLGLQFPNNLNTHQLISYLRGFFDGDGSIKKTGSTITFQIDCTDKNFLLNIKNFLKDNFNIDSQILIRPKELDKKSTIDQYRLYFYGKEKCLKIYNLFYNNDEIYMKRKKEKFQELLK